MVALGMSLMALSSDLFFLIVCLELASMASYVLVGFHKETEVGGEAGAKYFIVGSVCFCHWNIRHVAALHLVRQPGLR